MVNKFCRSFQSFFEVYLVLELVCRFRPSRTASGKGISLLLCNLTDPDPASLILGILLPNFGSLEADCEPSSVCLGDPKPGSLGLLPVSTCVGLRTACALLLKYKASTFGGTRNLSKQRGYFSCT